jgi:hypothetical protein
MTEIRWTADRVITAILSRGYQRIPGPGATLWFVSPQSTSEVAQYLVLEHKARVDAYAVHFGVSSKHARAKISRVEPILRAMPVTRWPPSDTPCWTLFNAGRALDWGYLAIPDPTQVCSGAAQFANLCDEVLVPSLEAVVTCHAVLHTLLRAEKPFDWGATNPVTRATEVIATSMVEGIDLEECKLDLMKFQPALHSGMRFGPLWGNTLNSLIVVLKGG